MSETLNVAEAPLLAPETPDARRSPAQFLRAIYLERKSKNPQYSLNAFARDLELSSSQVSRLLSGSRAFTLKQVFHIASILGLSDGDTQNLVVEVIKKSNQNAKVPKRIREQYLGAEKSLDNAAGATVGAVTPNFYSTTNLMYLQYEVERFKSISQWYHLAILNLTFTRDFKSDPQHIAERLGITALEAGEAIDRLLHLNLLRREADGSLKKTQENLYVKTLRAGTAKRKFHEDMIEKAKDQLKKTEDTAFKERLINSITFACGAEHIEKLKEMIDQFQDQVLAYTKPGPHEEIYQFNFQLFPLTKKSGGQA